MNAYFYLVNAPTGIELIETRSKADLFKFGPRSFQVLTGPFETASEAEDSLGTARENLSKWAPSFVSDNSPKAIGYLRSGLQSQDTAETDDTGDYDGAAVPDIEEPTFNLVLDCLS